MYIIMLAMMVPAASGLVDCRSACRSCRENKEIPAIVEVYCSMCEECKERRREKFTATTHRDESFNFLPDRVRYEEYPPPPTTDPFIFGPTKDNIIKKIRNEFASADNDGYPLRHFNDNDHEKRQRRRCPAARQAHHQYSSSEEYRRLRAEDIPEGCPTPPACSDQEQTTTCAPTTCAATTCAPTTCVAETTTCAATTCTPTTCAPTTCAPTTCAPTTCAPTTCAPTTCAPTTCAPKPNTCAPTTCAPKPNPCAPTTCGPVTTTCRPVGQQCTCQPTAVTVSTPSNDYIYMYVGVPKKLIKP